MEISIRRADGTEYEKVRDFYYALIDAMQGAEYHPKWQKGIYPEDEYMEAAVKNGEMYLTEADGRLIGAMVLNHATNDGYAAVQWPTGAAPDEVTVIHTLGVMPDLSCRGVGARMVEEAKRLAREAGQKVMRLDVLCGNLPAEKLYKRAGFVYVETLKLFYEDTGWVDFDLYEYVL